MIEAVVGLGVLLALSTTALGITLVRLRRSRRRVARLEERLDELVEGAVPTRKGPARVAELAVRGVIGTATLVRRQGVGGLLMTSIDELSKWAMDERREIEAEIDALAGTDGAVTILFSDIVGSTSMNDEIGDESWVQLLIAHDTMVRAHVERYRGHIVKSQGDGFMIVFTTPSRAVRAGLAVQRSFSETWSRAMRRSPISVRIGIHTGTVVARGGDYFGRNVAMAARVGAAANGGELLVSDEVADALVEDARFLITPARTVELKGFSGQHLLHGSRSIGRTGPCPRRPPMAEPSTGPRRMVGIAGPPGAGKTTIATSYVRSRRRAGVAASYLPMDGFHLADATLDALGLRDRKGAPETFDAWGYAALLARLRRGESHPVYAPGFERDLEQPIAAAVVVPPDAELVVTEGNYLLLDRPEWRAVRALLDEVWYVDVDPAVRHQRLVERHVRFGKTPAEAEAWVSSVDEPNARLVEASRVVADRVVTEHDGFA